MVGPAPGTQQMKNPTHVPRRIAQRHCHTSEGFGNRSQNLTFNGAIFEYSSADSSTSATPNVPMTRITKSIPSSSSEMP